MPRGRYFDERNLRLVLPEILVAPGGHPKAVPAIDALLLEKRALVVALKPENPTKVSETGPGR